MKKKPTLESIQRLLEQSEQALRDAHAAYDSEAEDAQSRGQELEDKSDRLFDEAQAAKRLREKYERVEALRESAGEIREGREGRTAAGDPNPDEDFTRDQRIERTELIRRFQRHGRKALTDGEFRRAFVLLDQREKAWWSFIRHGYRSMPDAHRQMLMAGEERLIGEALASLPPDQQRTIGTSTVANANAGFTIPEGFYALIVADMAVWGPMADMGFVRNITTSMGNDLPVPVEHNLATVECQYVGEGQSGGENDPDFGSVLMRAFKYGTKQKINYEILEDTGVDLEGFLREFNATAFGRGLNRLFTTGNGAGTGNNQQPIHGIVTVTGAHAARRDSDDSLAANAQRVQTAHNTNLAADDLIDLMHLIDPAYRMNASLQVHDNTVAVMRKFKDNDGQYLWQRGLVEGEPDRFNGKPVRVNQALGTQGTATAKLAVFGDPASYFVRRVNAMRMKRGDEVLMDTDQILFTCFWRVDGAPVRPRGIGVLERKT